MRRQAIEPNMEILVLTDNGAHQWRRSGEGTYGLFMRPGNPDGDGEVHVDLVSLLAAVRALGLNRADLNLALDAAGFR